MFGTLSVVMKSFFKKSIFFFALAVVFSLFGATSVHANHAWGNYHWARTSNPFTLKLGNNLTSNWVPYLITASGDWSLSTVLDTAIVPGGTNPRTCKPTSGRDEVCNSTYGKNGWLGIAQIWANGDHITQGVTKMNDTYFNTAAYNAPAWRQLVICQEIAHTFGLDHQDEVFTNPNLGTCMDYTNNPLGPLDNTHPNQHDYDELVTIYSHLDAVTTISQTKAQLMQSLAGSMPDNLGDNPSEWGKSIRDNGRVALFQRDFGAGQKVFTFVIWSGEK